MRCLAVVEARMGSSRFPGKVLAPLAGMPVLQHLAKRLATCQLLERIVLATSTSPLDDVLAQTGAAFGFEVIRGPEDDLLARHLLVHERYVPDIIVRVTGDCPLVDPDIIDRLIRLLVETGAEYATVHPGTPCIHQGIDPFRTSVLLKLASKHGQDPYVQEHVVSWLKSHQEFAPIAFLEIPEREQFLGARISVDTPSDLTFLEAIYSCLGAAPGEADIRDVADLLRARPWLLSINNHVQQKVAGAPSLRVVLRQTNSVDGINAATLAAVAEALRDVHGVGVRVVGSNNCDLAPPLCVLPRVNAPHDFKPDILIDSGSGGKFVPGIPTVMLTQQNDLVRITPGPELKLTPVLENHGPSGVQASAAFLALCARQRREATC